MLSCCFQEMRFCLPQTCSTVANVPHFQPQMESKKDIDVFANKPSELSNMTFPGDKSESAELDCLHPEVLWRKSGGLFSSLSVQWWVTALHWRQSIHIHWRCFRDTGKTRWKEEDRCLKKWVRIVALCQDINFINLLWRCLVSKIKLINTWRNQFTTVCFTMCCENKKFLSLALDTCLWNHSDYNPIYFHGKRIKC